MFIGNVGPTVHEPVYDMKHTISINNMLKLSNAFEYWNN